MLRFLTAGESHGPGLTAILEGLPPGIDVSIDELVAEQARRRYCYGRGGRSAIERDEIEITGGVSAGITTGAPVSLFIPNRDYQNWIGKHRPITVPRPGHADLAGVLKYGFSDCRPVAERASARETAARVGCGYFAKRLLAKAGMRVVSWVTSIGQVKALLPDARMKCASLALGLAEAAEASPVRCPDPRATELMKSAIDEARLAGDSLGGVFEVAVLGAPAGLGSYVHWDRRLDSALAGAVMSINSVKAVEIGEGFGLSGQRGSEVHDLIVLSSSEDESTDGHKSGVKAHTCRLGRASNRAGGIEGGVSNGQTIFLRAAVKPVPMLAKPLQSVDLATGKACDAHVERSDVAIPGSAAVVAEAMVAFVVAGAYLERYGHDGVLMR